MQSDPIKIPNTHSQEDWMEPMRKQGKTIEDIVRESSEREYSSGTASTPLREDFPIFDDEPDEPEQD